MGRVLKQNVVLRQSLTSPVYSFRKGEELPDWAADLVGDHVFEEKQAEPAFSRVKKTGLPSAPPVKEEKKEIEVPGRSSAKAKWAAFLDESGIEYPEDASRDDMIEIAEAKIEGIEI